MKVSVSKIENGLVRSTLKKVEKQGQPAFRGNVASTVANKSLKSIANELVDKSYPGWLKKLIHLGNNNGEILNTIVTGIGTAFVAPMFIVWNPLAKEDKETRAYSAWRQPISAVLAVVTQIAINKKFNNWMDKEASVGSFDRMNLTAKPRESYLRTLLKFQHPDWSKKEIEKEIKKEQNKRMWAKIDSSRKDPLLREQVKTMPLEDFVDKDAFNAAKEQIKGKIEATAKQMKDEGKSFAEIRAYKKAHGEKYITAEAMKKASAAIAEELEIDAQIKWVVRKYQLATEYLDKIAKASNNPAKLQELAAKVNPEVKEVADRFADYLKSNPDKTIFEFAMNEVNSQSTDHLKKLFGIADDINFTQINQVHLIEKFQGTKEFCEKRKKELLEMIETASKDTKAYISTQLDNLKSPFGSMKPLGNSIDEIRTSVKIKRLVKKQISDATNVLKDQKTKWGIIVSLITLPFSCGLLNWVYPRLMEKIMPEMANKKKAQQNKTEARA